MELANGSGSAEEIYDLLVNATDNMESLLNKTTKDMLKEKLAHMVESLKELKTEVGDIDNGLHRHHHRGARDLLRGLLHDLPTLRDQAWRLVSSPLFFLEHYICFLAPVKLI